MDLDTEADQAVTAAADQAEALYRLGNYISTCARDWSEYHADAWIWGLFCGWDCEDQHQHSDACCDGGAMTEVAETHAWDEATVTRLRRYRAAIAATQAQYRDQTFREIQP